MLFRSADINIDMIVQNVSSSSGLTDISFTLPKADGQTAINILQKIQGEIGFQSIQYDDQIGKLSLIGAGMRSHPGVTATFFACLADAGVNIEMISTSEIRISIICRATDLEKAVKSAHTAFDLDADAEAVKKAQSLCIEYAQQSWLKFEQLKPIGTDCIKSDPEDLIQLKSVRDLL